MTVQQGQTGELEGSGEREGGGDSTPCVPLKPGGTSTARSSLRWGHNVGPGDVPSEELRFAITDQRDNTAGDVLALHAANPARSPSPPDSLPRTTRSSS